MKYFYDGQKLIGIECRTWDNEEHRYLYAETEEDGILHPEYENLPTLSSAGPVDGGYVYAVLDVQWYIDEAEAWEKYQIGESEDYTEQEDGEAERYQRSAYIEELDVAVFEAEYAGYEEVAPGERPTIAQVKAAIAAKA